MAEAEARDPAQLVFALCHEVRNLLAATRLQAHLLASDAEEGEIAATTEKISAMAARAGSLLAQVRPLLSPPAGPFRLVDPVDVLNELRRDLDEDCERSVRIDLKAAAALPEAEIDSESIHHLLLTAVFCGLDAAGPGQRVRVSAEAVGKQIAFTVENEGPQQDEPSEPFLSGRSLTWILAEAILGQQGGQLQVQRRDALTRVELRVPAAAGTRS
jgi:nitrogen-specific signal transduction histidine kinase